MQATIETYGQPILNEIVHMEVMRLPVAVAQMVRDKMGPPYAADATLGTARWSGCFTVPGSRRCAHDVRLPFELVMCGRGASLRCSWNDLEAIADLIERMVPEIIVELIPNKIVTPAHAFR